MRVPTEFIGRPPPDAREGPRTVEAGRRHVHGGVQSEGGLEEGVVAGRAAGQVEPQRLEGDFMVVEGAQAGGRVRRTSRARWTCGQIGAQDQHPDEVSEESIPPKDVSLAQAGVATQRSSCPRVRINKLIGGISTMNGAAQLAPRNAATSLHVAVAEPQHAPRRGQRCARGSGRSSGSSSTRLVRPHASSERTLRRRPGRARAWSRKGRPGGAGRSPGTHPRPGRYSRFQRPAAPTIVCRDGAKDVLGSREGRQERAGSDYPSAGRTAGRIITRRLAALGPRPHVGAGAPELPAAEEPPESVHVGESTKTCAPGTSGRAM